MISVLIRTYNRPTLLLQAVQSVIDQTYSPIEIIVVNDGGECVQELLAEKLNPLEIAWQYQLLTPSAGRSAAANAAIELASGEAMLFLDDDDWLAPEHLENLAKVLFGNDECLAAYSDTVCVSRDDPQHAIRHFCTDFDANRLAYENFLPIHSVLFKRAVVSQYNCRFDVELEIYEDWHFWIQVASFGRLCRVPEITAFYSVDTSGIGVASEQSFLPERIAFLRKATPLMTDEQLLYMNHSAVSLAKANLVIDQLSQEKDQQSSQLEQSTSSLKSANEVVDRLSRENDEQTLLIERQQFHLEQWNMHDKAQNETIRDLEGRCIELKGHSDELEIEKSQLIELHSERYAALVEKHAHHHAELVEQQMCKQLEMSERMQTSLLEMKEQLVAQNHYWGVRGQHLEQRVEQLESRLLKRNGAFLGPIYRAGSIGWRYAGAIKRKSITMLRLLARGEYASVKLLLLNNLAKVKRILLPAPPALVEQPEFSAASAGYESSVEVSILSTHHTLFVAKLLQDALSGFGLSSEVLEPECQEFSAGLHIVICPQMFDVLPRDYIAFQMEQSVSSRWFNESYIDILHNARAVLDYSLENIKYLQAELGLNYKQVFYTPISNLKDYYKADVAINKEYDLVFYGDVNNDRRRAFLRALEAHYRVLVVGNCFGEELYASLLKAKLVVNIHYYENALLETTRINECLSLGLPIVSESSSDIDEHGVLQGLVEFTPIGDIEAMVKTVGKMLQSESTKAFEVPEDLYQFKYYLGRMLVALDLLDVTVFDRLDGIVSSKALSQGVGLSLPETYERCEAFAQEYPDKLIFPGLRHRDGWKGCSLSFRYLTRQALEQGLDSLEIWEDDAIFIAGNRQKWQQSVEFFKANAGRFDVLCGLIADLSPEARILEVVEHNGLRYAVIDKMVSMVCNVYGKNALALIAQWDIANGDVHSNTIDRYLESQSLRVLVPIPFLASHRPDKDSTLWGFNNTTYDEMIHTSEKQLTKKVQKFLKARDK